MKRATRKNGRRTITLPSGSALRAVVMPEAEPLDPAQVRDRLWQAAMVLRDRNASGAERAEASATMKWLDAVRNPEDKRLVGAWLAKYSPEEISIATGINPDVVRRRFTAAIAAIVAKLAAK